MAIPAACPHCGHAVKVADHLAGKKIRCNGCQAVFRVPAEEEVEPATQRPRSRPSAVTPSARTDRADAKGTAPRRKREETTEKRRPAGRAGGGSAGLLWAAGAGIIVLLLIGGGIVAAILLYRGKDSPSGTVVQLPANGSPHAAGPQLPTPLVEWSDREGGILPDPGARGLQVWVRGRLVRVVPLTQPIREKSIEVWFTIADVNQHHTTLVRVEDGVETWDGIVYGEAPREWYPGSSFRDRSGSLGGPVEAARPTDLVHLVMVYSPNGPITLYRNGTTYGSFTPSGGTKFSLRSYPAENTIFRIGGGRENERGAWQGDFQGDIKLARLYNRILWSGQVMDLFNDGKARFSGATGTPQFNPPPTVIPQPGPSESLNGPQAATGPAAFSLTAEGFVAEYTKDKQAASQKYKGKIIELSGVVKAAYGDIEGIIGLAAGDEILGLPCITGVRDEPWARVTPGQKVKVKGVWPLNAEGLGLRGCQVVEAGPNPAVVLTAEQLAGEYGANPEAVKKKYDEKYMILSGVVVSKKRTDRGTYAVSLKGTGRIHIEFSYGAAYEWDVAKLKEGQPAKVSGQFSKYGCEKDYINFENPKPITR